jgi:hypothetical protein
MNSSSVSVIEFLIVGVIVIIQASLASRTSKQIKLLSKIIPGPEFFEIVQYYIPLEDLQAFKPAEILENLSLYEKKEKLDNANDDTADETIATLNFSQTGNLKKYTDKMNEVSLVNPDQISNPVFDEIVLAINVYLLRNKGAASDFNLIKDVVERNVDVEEDEINSTVTIPLYLGLMGTIIGIVFGLLTLFLVSDADKDFDIKSFLGGVSIAMFASFFGLFCTVANSSFNLKTARRNLERAKNSFYTFLQTELLPVINTSVSSSIYLLNANLVNFNDSFTINLNRLSIMLNTNHDALIAQERILQTLEKVDITEFAKANVLVLKELKVGTERLEQFNTYLNALSQLASDTASLSTSFKELLARSNNFEGVAEKLDLRVEESNKLIQFLNDHFQQLNERGELIRNSVVKVDDILIKSLVQLEEHTQAKIVALKENEGNLEDFMTKSLKVIEDHLNEKIAVIKQITVKEEELLSQTIAENDSYISKLGLLEDLNNSVKEMRLNSGSKVDNIRDEVKSLKRTVELSNLMLTEIIEKNSIFRSKNITRTIKRFFGSKE